MSDNLKNQRELMEKYWNERGLDDEGFAKEVGIEPETIKAFIAGMTNHHKATLSKIESYLEHRRKEVSQSKEVFLPLIAAFAREAIETGKFPHLALKDVPCGKHWGDMPDNEYYAVPAFFIRDAYRKYCEEHNQILPAEGISFSSKVTKFLKFYIPGLTHMNEWIRIPGGRLPGYTLPPIKEIRSILPAGTGNIKITYDEDGASRLAFTSKKTGPLTAEEIDILLEFFTRVTAR